MPATDALKQLMFENVMERLGYKIKTPLIIADKYTEKRATHVGPHPFWFITYIVPYQNKASYLYYRYIDAGASPKDSLIKGFAENIDYENDTVMAEVGWEVKYQTHPSNLDKRERAKLMIKFNRACYDNIHNGMFGYTPKSNYVLTCEPKGAKIDAGPSLISWKDGAKNREAFAKRVGFSSMKKNGWCYGIYDENVKLKPL